MFPEVAGHSDVSLHILVSEALSQIVMPAEAGIQAFPQFSVIHIPVGRLESCASTAIGGGNDLHETALICLRDSRCLESCSRIYLKTHINFFLEQFFDLHYHIFGR